VALWWVVREVDGKRQFYLQKADTQMYAGLRSAMDGFEGALKEVIPLGAKAARKVPKDLVGRVLKQREAMKLLKKLG
jgi:hypothetical protein